MQKCNNTNILIVSQLFGIHSQLFSDVTKIWHKITLLLQFLPNRLLTFTTTNIRVNRNYDGTWRNARFTQRNVRFIDKFI